MHLILLIFTSVACALGCDLESAFADRQVSVEESLATCDIAFRGMALAPLFHPSSVFTVYFDLIDTYKGAEKLIAWGVDNTRRINVTFSPKRLPECADGDDVPRAYIVFCDMVNGEIRATSLAKWDEATDQRVWEAFGWSEWGEWSSCSVSCSLGIQQRKRHCLRTECPSFNVEQRHCNFFGCLETVNALTVPERQFFHPSKDRWLSVPERPTAYRLRPNSYIWLPSAHLFSSDAHKPFPREFSLFLTLRLHNVTMGTVFSLRSRRRQDTYLSLEVAGSDLKLIHAAANGTDVVRIPGHLDDGHWHQIAVSIRDDSVVESYVDCEWAGTDLLRSHTLDIPDDSDLIIGYLFTGDLEQLTIVPDPRVVSLQCSSQLTAIIDSESRNTIGEIQEKTGKHIVVKIHKNKRRTN